MQNNPQNSSGSTGSVAEFDANWTGRKEARYNHWCKGPPRNQIQLAFRRHWILFEELMQGCGYKTCLEVGCGRGSISSYFAEHGFDCTLLDASEHVLETARSVFETNGHRADFIHADALAMPFEDSRFDAVVSIGLLEHFEEIKPLLSEQWRVLKPGGMFLGYVVPERPDNIQRSYRWINKCLAGCAKIFSKNTKNAVQKSDVYRSDYGSERYVPVIEKLGVQELNVMGVYPLPMISHSPEFPFSLLPAPMEWLLTRFYECVLFVRRILFRRNPWICRESYGQAFLIVFKKGAE